MKRPLQESTTLPPENTENADVKAGPAPSKRMRKSKPAMSDHNFSSGEISKLKETEGLHHSGLFRLQMNELLKEVAVKQKLKQRLEEAVEAFTSLLQGLPAGKEHKIIDRKWLEKKSVKVPFVEKPFAVKGTFRFFPPSSVRLTGSVVLDTVVKPDVETDLILTMPQACFQTKDYLNQRCMRKQALYLAAVSSHLSKNKRVEDLKFSYHQGNPLKPSLIVTFRGKDSKKVTFCLRAVPELETFKPARFHVNKNNVRPRWYFEQSGVEEEEKDDITSLPATPLYNSSMLHDICSATNDAFVEKMIMGSEGVRHGVMLLKVWLRQRSLLQGYGAFSSYLITCFVTYLLMKTKLNKLMNCYQVFRTTLVYLSKSDWTLEPPSLFEGDPEKSLPSFQEFQAASPCVFVDRTGYLNLAYMVSAPVFVRVKEEAKLSLEMLDMSRPNSFDTLFMIPISFPRKFDHIFHIALHSELLKKACNQVDNLAQKSMDFGGQLSLALQLHLQQLLSKGLERRITLIHALPAERKTWDISDEPFSYDDRKVLTFGLNLDAGCAFSILDKGPPADSAEAKEFSEFWGEKSEMRRFKDGTIHEAVLWTSSPLQSDRRLICKSIIQHVLSRHCGIAKSHINYIGGQLDSLLHLRLSRKGDIQQYGTGEEESLAVIHAFDDVNRSLRALASLPLAIHSIQGIHPVFRHSDVFPPLPAPGVREESRIIRRHVIPVEEKSQSQYVPAITVICTLEGSGKWPEDKKAIDCLKSLIHVKMGAELRDKHLLSVSICGTHVDVFKDGFVFRLKIASTRELAVLRTVKTESGMVRFRDTDQSLALEKEIVATPLLTNLLHGVQQQHPAFSATVRLCKRWMAAQMMWDLIPEEVVELVVAYIFTSSFPYTPPASPSVGLCRFLHLLSTFNWQADPLMVNLNKEFTEEDYATIPKLMSKNRATLPSMCIMTPADKQGTKWTRSNPSETFLQRIVILAKEALKILESQIMSPAFGADFKTIFRPPLEHFDLVIRLLKKANLLHHQAVDSNYEVPMSQKEVRKTNHLAFPVTEFNVVRKFIGDLQDVFGDFAVFFHDPFGGDIIGVVWKPQALEKKDFKPSSFAYRKPVVDENETVGLEIVKEAVLDDIRVLGGGIVESVGPPTEGIVK